MNAKDAGVDESWGSYKWPEVQMRWSVEDAGFLCRWREFPSATVFGACREDALSELMGLTPTFMCVIADLPRADVRDAAEVARSIAVGLELRVAALERKARKPKKRPTPTAKRQP